MSAEEVVHFPEHLVICSADRVVAVNSDLSILGLHINTGQVLFRVDNYGNTLQENLVACGYLRDKLVVPCEQSLHVFFAETGEKILQIENRDMGDEKFQCFDPISGNRFCIWLILNLPYTCDHSIFLRDIVFCRNTIAGQQVLCFVVFQIFFNR